MVDAYYSPQPQALSLRKLLGVLAGIVVVILGAWLVWRYFATATLTVVPSSSSAKISVIRVSASGTNNPAPIKTGSGRLSLRLGGGTYSIVAKDGAASSQKVIVLQTRHNQLIHLPINQPVQAEPVVSQAAINVFAGSDQLLYTDITNDYLYQVTGDNQLHILDTAHKLTTIQWADAAFGVGQGQDGRLYLIQSGVISPLQVPFTYGSGRVVFAVAPNHDIYISADRVLYQGNSGNFSKLYTLPKPVGFIAASNDAAAVFASIDEDSSKGSSPEKDDNDASFFVVDRAGKALTTTGDFVQAVWSPDGSKLAASVDGKVLVWNSHLRLLKTLPNNGAANLVWSNDTLAYSVGSDIWTYNVTNSEGSLLATSGVNTITSMVSEPGGPYIYMSLSNQNANPTTYKLARVQPRGRSASALLQNLEIFLPNTLNGCTLGYLNFSSLVITAEGPSSAQQTCLDAAKGYLKQYDIDTNELGFDFVSAS